MNLLGIAESLHQEAKSKKCLIWHIKWLKIILWPLTQESVNRARFELFALHGAKILQTKISRSASKYNYATSIRKELCNESICYNTICYNNGKF